MHEYFDAFKKYFIINGRASRRDYWMFILFNLIFGVIILAIMKIVGLMSFSIWQIFIEFIFIFIFFTYSAIVFIPGITLTIRRLHDINKNGWWIFISWIPIVGGLWLLFLLLKKGDSVKNEYGEVPTERIGKSIQWRKIIIITIFTLFGFGIVLFFIYMVNDFKESEHQKKVNEDNRIRIEEEINSVILPTSFVIESVRRGINEGGDVKDFSQKLTFIDNILTEGEYFYNIKEGPHCTNDSNNCIHNIHCVVANGQWSGDDECRGQSPTIKDIKQNLRDTMMYIKLEELDKCPLSEYVTCYKMTEIK